VELREEAVLDFEEIAITAELTDRAEKSGKDSVGISYGGKTVVMLVRIADVWRAFRMQVSGSRHALYAAVHMPEFIKGKLSEQSASQRA
jgi:hypothetical protein